MTQRSTVWNEQPAPWIMSKELSPKTKVVVENGTITEYEGHAENNLCPKTTDVIPVIRQTYRIVTLITLKVNLSYFSYF